MKTSRSYGGYFMLIKKRSCTRIIIASIILILTIFAPNVSFRSANLSDTVYISTMKATAKNSTISKKQAKKKLIRWLKKKKKWYSKCIFEYDHMQGKYYVFHQYTITVYEDGSGHTCTMGWYGVHKKTGKIKDIIFS